ncbi:hypothetical protein V2J09_005044 [Rumex salicifolius]
MTDLGSLHYFFGISVNRNSVGLHISREKYSKEILTKAGSLQYLTFTFPNTSTTHLSNTFWPSNAYSSTLRELSLLDYNSATARCHRSPPVRSRPTQNCPVADRTCNPTLSNKICQLNFSALSLRLHLPTTTN